MNMRNLNDLDGREDGAGKILLRTAARTLDIFGENVIGVEMGIAYGGGVEAIGKMWKTKGIIYGFDTFEGLPKDIALKDPDCNFSKQSFAATCMDYWYSIYDNKELTLEYQQQELDKQGLNNVKLVKGLIDESTNVDFIPYLNYAFLDLDLPLSMKNAYNLIEHKLVKDSFLCLHDVLPKGHINGLYEFYQNLVSSKKYKVVGEYGMNVHLAVLQKL